MATILSFTPRTSPAGRPPPAVGAAASVIIFPGIRYEHADDAERRRDAPTPLPPTGPVGSKH